MIYISMYVYIHVNIHVHVCQHIYQCVYTYGCVYTHICMYVTMYDMSVRICVYGIYWCVHILVCKPVCQHT